MKENLLNTKEQLAVLVLSTLAGFTASKITENGLTKFIMNHKPTS